MTNLAWLRPHFNSLTEDWWTTTKLAYQLYGEIVQLTNADVRRAIHDLLGDRPDVNIELLDNTYRTYPRAIFERTIADDRTNRSMAWPERGDCNNYGLRFKVAMDFWYNVDAVGFVVDHSAGHAYDLVVFGDVTASLLEPQSDRFVAVGEEISFLKGLPLPAGSSGRYSLTSGVILI